MKSERAFQLKRYGFLGVVVLSVILALFAFRTSAKYTETKKVYTDFEAALFNAIILGPNVKPDMKDEGTIYEFGTEYTKEMFPGMETRDLPFTISNGGVFTSGTGTEQVVTDNASDVDVEYTLRLLSTNNIPLTFKLAVVNEAGVIQKDDSNKDIIYEAVAKAPAARTSTELYDTTEWTEYSFVKTTTVTGKGGEPEVKKEEMVFTLKGGELNLDHYKILIDWPIVAATGSKKATNSHDYQKEFDNLQLLVTVKSARDEDPIPAATGDPADEGEKRLNQNDEPGYIKNYGTGIIIDTPAEEHEMNGSSVHSFVEEVDLRSFRTFSDTVDLTLPKELYNAYEIEVNNGYGFGESPRTSETGNFTYYTVQVRIPVEELTGCDYDLYYQDKYDYDGDNDKTDYLKLTKINSYYIKVNELTGTITKLCDATYDTVTGWTVVPTIEDEDNKYRIYRVDTLAWGDTLAPTKIIAASEAGNMYPGAAVFQQINYDTVTEQEQADNDRFILQLVNPGNLAITDDLAFLNKLQVKVNAVYTNMAASAASLFQGGTAEPPAENAGEKK